MMGEKSVQAETHDMTDRSTVRENFNTYQHEQIAQYHIQRIGEVIKDANNHNRYVRTILCKHLIQGGYCSIKDMKDRKAIHHAYAMCQIARDAYNGLATSLPTIKQKIDLNLSNTIDMQRDMLQNVLELLEKDVQTALHHMK